MYKSHDLMPYISRSADFGQFSIGKTFVIGRLFSSTDGSRLKFY